MLASHCWSNIGPMVAKSPNHANNGQHWQNLQTMQPTANVSPTAECYLGYCLINRYCGHGGRVATLSPPTSEAGVRFPAQP